MFRIAICEDETECLNRIKDFLILYEAEHHQGLFKVDSFCDMESLFVKENVIDQYDLLLLDIYMGKMNGIEAARELRTKGFQGQIVFMTSSRDFALLAISVDATQYLLKPVEKQPFFNAIDKVLVSTQNRTHDCIMVHTVNGNSFECPGKCITWI